MLSDGSSPDSQCILDFNPSFAHECGKCQRVWNHIFLQPDSRFFRIFVFMLNTKNYSACDREHAYEEGNVNIANDRADNENSYWRDAVALTGTLETQEGGAQISDKLLNLVR